MKKTGDGEGGFSGTGSGSIWAEVKWRSGKSQDKRKKEGEAQEHVVMHPGRGVAVCVCVCCVRL